MNKHILFFLCWSIISLMISCKPKIEPKEQMLFENLEGCKTYWSLLDSTGLVYEKLIKSDSVIIKNVKGVLSEFKIKVDVSLLAKIDPKRFPYWGEGYPLRPCNLPEPLRNHSYNYEIEYDCVFYQHIPVPPRVVNFISWPIRLTRVKVLNKTAK